METATTQNARSKRRKSLEKQNQGIPSADPVCSHAACSISTDVRHDESEVTLSEHWCILICRIGKVIFLPHQIEDRLNENIYIVFRTLAMCKVLINDVITFYSKCSSASLIVRLSMPGRSEAKKLVK